MSFAINHIWNELNEEIDMKQLFKNLNINEKDCDILYNVQESWQHI